MWAIKRSLVWGILHQLLVVSAISRHPFDSWSIKVLQKLTKSYKSELRHLFQCCILIPRNVHVKPHFNTQWRELKIITNIAKYLENIILQKLDHQTLIFMQQLVFTMKNNDLQDEASLDNIIFVKMSGDQIWKPEKGMKKAWQPSLRNYFQSFLK